MKNRVWAGAAALGLVAAGAVATSATAAAATAAPPIVTISVAGDQATVSQATVRPGVVEFHVGNTFTVPGDQGGPDTLSVVRTDQLDLILSTLPAVFAGDPGDPASMAASAAAMRTIHSISTWYGGAQKGGVWQVVLPAGNYFVFGAQSTAMGLAKAVPFTVSGDPRVGTVHATQAVVRAVGTPGANRWTYRQLPGQPVQWLRFTNSAQEIHFLDMTGVKPTTTNAMVRKAFQSNGDPKWVTGPFYNFDVLSPGVSVAIKGPIKPGRYLVDCFIPSETDGMPHALMGMWRLVDVR